MKNIPIVVYLIIGTANILGYALNMPDLVKFSKPMLMPALINFDLFQGEWSCDSKNSVDRHCVDFQLGGDLALMQNSETYFSS